MQLTIKHPFLCLPVVSHPKDTRVLKLFDGEKLLLCVYFPFGEAAADNGTYSYEYLSPLPVSEWMGRTLTLSAEFPAGFEDAVTQTDDLPVSSEVHPAVHFTANAGWINDPNGLSFFTVPKLLTKIVAGKFGNHHHALALVFEVLQLW